MGENIPRPASSTGDAEPTPKTAQTDITPAPDAANSVVHDQVPPDETLQLLPDQIQQAIFETAFSPLTRAQVDEETGKFNAAVKPGKTLANTLNATVLSPGSQADPALVDVIHRTQQQPSSFIVQAQEMTVFQRLSDAFLARAQNSTAFQSVRSIAGAAFDSLKAYTLSFQPSKTDTPDQIAEAVKRIEATAQIIEFFNTAVQRVIELSQKAFDDRAAIVEMNKVLSLHLTKFTLLALSLRQVAFGDKEQFRNEVLGDFFSKRLEKDRNLRKQGTQLGSFPIAFQLKKKFRELLAQGTYRNRETGMPAMPKALQTAWTISGLLTIGRLAASSGNKDYLALKDPETKQLASEATVLVLHKDTFFTLKLDAQKPISPMSLANKLSFLDKQTLPLGSNPIDKVTRAAIRRIMYERTSEERPAALKELFGERYGQITAIVALADDNTHEKPTEAVQLLQYLHESPDTLAGLTGNGVPLTATIQFDTASIGIPTPAGNTQERQFSTLKNIALHASHASIYGLDLLQIGTQLNGYNFLQASGLLKTTADTKEPTYSAYHPLGISQLAQEESALSKALESWSNGQERWWNAGLTSTPAIPPELISHTMLSTGWNEYLTRTIPELKTKHDVSFSINLLMILGHMLNNQEWKLHNMVTDAKGRLLVSEAVLPQIETTKGGQFYALIDTLVKYCANDSEFCKPTSSLVKKVEIINRFINTSKNAHSLRELQQELIEAASWARHSIDVCLGKRGTEDEVPTVPLFAYAAGDAEAFLSALAKHVMNLKEENKIFNETTMVSCMASGQQLDKNGKIKEPGILIQAKAALKSLVEYLITTGELANDTNIDQLVQEMIKSIPIGAVFATAESEKYIYEPSGTVESITKARVGGNLGVCEVFNVEDNSMETHITTRIPFGQLIPEIMRRIQMRTSKFHSKEVVSEYRSNALEMLRSIATGTQKSREAFWNVAPQADDSESAIMERNRLISLCINEARQIAQERGRNFEIILLFITQLLRAK